VAQGAVAGSSGSRHPEKTCQLLRWSMSYRRSCWWWVLLCLLLLARSKNTSN